MFLIINIRCTGQPSVPSIVQTSKEHYLIKSKKLKTTAQIFGAAGLLGLTIGGIAELSNFNIDFFDDAAYEPRPSYTWLYLTSGALIATGVSFYIGSLNAKQKSKTSQVSFRFKMDELKLVQKTNVISKPLPAISFRLSL